MTKLAVDNGYAHFESEMYFNYLGYLYEAHKAT